MFSVFKEGYCGLGCEVDPWDSEVVIDERLVIQKINRKQGAVSRGAPRLEMQTMRRQGCHLS